MSIKQH